MWQRRCSGDLPTDDFVTMTRSRLLACRATMPDSKHVCRQV